MVNKNFEKQFELEIYKKIRVMFIPLLLLKHFFFLIKSGRYFFTIIFIPRLKW